MGAATPISSSDPRGTFERPPPLETEGRGIGGTSEWHARFYWSEELPVSKAARARIGCVRRGAARRGAAKEGAQGVGLTLQLAQLRHPAAAAEQPSSQLPPPPFPRPGRG